MAIRSATSLGVRYSRVRTSPFLRRRGVTVRFLVGEATRLRCDLASIGGTLALYLAAICVKRYRRAINVQFLAVHFSFGVEKIDRFALSGDRVSGRKEPR